MLKINDIGIEICCACPHPDCIAPASKGYCHLIEDEASKIKEIAIQEKKDKDNKILEIVNQFVGRTLYEVVKKFDGITYNQLQMLMRSGAIKVHRKSIPNRKQKKVVIIGVNYV